MYSCEHCHQFYSRKDNLKRHTVAVHGNNIRGIKEPLITHRGRAASTFQRNDINFFGFGIRPKIHSMIAPEYYLNPPKKSDNTGLKWKHPFTCKRTEIYI